MPDISPTSSVDVNDTPTGPSNPDATSSAQSTQPAPAPATPATPAPTAPSATTPATTPATVGSTPGTTPASTPALPAQAPKPVPPAAPAGVSPTNPNSQDPSVQRAGKVYTIAQALAGGTRYNYSVDPNTGETTKTPIPMSKAHIGLAIALEAISGGFSGLAAGRGAGNAGAAGAAGVAQGEKIGEKTQQQNQEAQQTANADYARHMQVMETNLKMWNLAQAVGDKDFETNQKVGAQFKPLADNVQTNFPTSVLGRGGEADAAKYHVTMNGALPTGNVIPLLDPKTGEQAVGKYGNKLWQQEYLFVDPSLKGEDFLSKDDKSTLVEMRKQGFADSDGKAANIPDNIQMKLGTAINLKSDVAAYNLSKDFIGNYYDKLNSLQPKSDKPLVAPNIAKAIQGNPQLTNALLNFQPFLNKAKGNIETAIGAMGAKDPQAAGGILNLLGGSDKIRSYDEQMANEAETAKKDADNQAALDKQKLLAPGELKEADRKAYGEASNRTQAEIDTKKRNGIPLGGDESYSVSNPQLAPLVTSANVGADGINHKFLDAMRTTDPQRAALVEAIAHGQRLDSFYGLAKKDGQALAADVQAADPSFDQSKIQSWNKFISQDMTPGGKVGLKIQAANTAQKHLANLVQNVTWMNSLASSIPGSSFVHVPGMAAAETDKQGLSSEIAKFYKGGAPDKEAVEALHKVLDAKNPANMRDGAAELSKLLNGGVDSIYQEAVDRRPSDHVAMPRFYDPQGAASYKLVTGEDVDPDLLGPRQQTQQPSGPGGSSHPFTPPAGAFAGRDGQGNIVQYKLPNGSVVDAKTGQPVTH